MNKLVKELLENERHGLTMHGRRLRVEIKEELERLEKWQKATDAKSAQLTEIEATIKGIDQLLEEDEDGGA